MDALLGVLTLGYKGAVGDHIGYSVLISLSAASLFVGCVVVAFRDADAAAQASLLDLETAPVATAPQGVNYWPTSGPSAPGSSRSVSSSACRWSSSASGSSPRPPSSGPPGPGPSGPPATRRSTGRSATG